MILVTVIVHHLLALPPRLRRRAETGSRGQATAEYALVILGAASLALLLVAWAARSGRVGDLLDSVFDTISRQVS